LFAENISGPVVARAARPPIIDARTTPAPVSNRSMRLLTAMAEISSKVGYARRTLARRSIPKIDSQEKEFL
jgi:hypothetical protein